MFGMHEKEDVVMRKEQALALHNADEVTLKETKEICKVVGDPKMVGKDVELKVLSKQEGYLTIGHKAIK